MHCHSKAEAVDLPGAYKLVRLSSGYTAFIHWPIGKHSSSNWARSRKRRPLYVRQLGLIERLKQTSGPFVIWDVGLGAAANVLTVPPRGPKRLNARWTFKVRQHHRASSIWNRARWRTDVLKRLRKMLKRFLQEGVF
jgi:hypothetical protein